MFKLYQITYTNLYSGMEVKSGWHKSEIAATTWFKSNGAGYMQNHPNWSRSLIHETVNLVAWIKKQPNKRGR
jgi:uncharacterized membrane protein (DUF441 family)